MANTGQSSERASVLYVDDQVGNLVVFKANFGKYLDVHTEASAARALETIERHEFPIVISDQRMDEMSGATLLAHVRERWPDTVRILMTAHTRFDDAVAAINTGEVWRFVSKPWDAQELLATLRGAAELHRNRKENRSLTRQLLRRERLSAIGQLTSGLVHELGNIGSLLQVADILRDEWNTGTDLTRELQALCSGVEKFTVLVHSIRLYAKGSGQFGVTTKTLDICTLCDRTKALLQLFPVVKQLSKLTVETPGEPILAPVDGNMIQQVLINLVKNAAEACPPNHGEVSITAEAGPDEVVLTVSDNGPGIAPDVEERVWDGLFTTKGDKGTGLGLVMCRNIARAHGGELALESSSKGAVFTLSLPRGEAAS